MFFDDVVDEKREESNYGNDHAPLGVDEVVVPTDCFLPSKLVET
jgi:hypothetical protein